MATIDWLQQIREFRFQTPVSHPALLYGAKDIPGLRKRASHDPAWLEKVRADGQAVLKCLANLLASNTEPYYELASLEAVSCAALVLADPDMALATEQIVERFLDQPQWVAHVHWPMPYDHAAANTASAIARALDAISETLTETRSRELRLRLAHKAVVPFTQACRTRGPFWTQRETESNWRIMTCSESGLAILATAEHNPDFRESLTYAAEGVLDTLDRVPSQGDWPEGPGYWLHTLGYGLRFCLALYRATGGAIDLFRHPALEATGDYITHLIKPDGSVYNFGDNRPTLDESLAYLSLLARTAWRPDWAWVAGRSTTMSLQRLLFEDPDLIVEEPRARAACFERTGVALLRSGWQPEDTFVGFKCGPSDVGHPHLDANSFVVALGGRDVLLDEGKWPYDHPNGFFESEGRRWNYDANHTVAHNTLLVDGKGQTWGPEHGGRIERYEEADSHVWLIGDASHAYPERLRKDRGFRRWLVFIPPELVVVLDELRATRSQHFEWLFHYGGSIEGGKSEYVIRNGPAVATLRWVYPHAHRLWRVTDSTRTTTYLDANSGQEVSEQIRYRAFGPIHRAQSLEALFVLSAGEPDAWTVDAPAIASDTITLRLSGPSRASWNVAIDRLASTVAVGKS